MGEEKTVNELLVSICLKAFAASESAEIPLEVDWSGYS
jgi:hypothetical protein